MLHKVWRLLSSPPCCVSSLYTALFPLSSHTGKNIKCKPCTESPEYEKWKTITIQIASPKIRCVQCHMRDTRENVLSKFIKLCTETPCWCPFEGHKYGGRKATETSAFEFSYKRVNSSLEELITVKVVFVLGQGIHIAKSENRERFKSTQPPAKCRIT